MIAAGASVGETRARLRRALGEHPDASLDAELLLMHVLGCSRAWLIAHDRDPLDRSAHDRLEGLAARRRAGEPMAYLLGWREFWSLELQVTPDVLIPRHETERLVECALARMDPDRPLWVADLGTGSGAVAIALARERPAAEVLATETSPGALVVAAGNIRRLGAAVRLVRGHWLDCLADASLDLVVSNPPYVAADDPHLARGDLRFEPRDALTPGGDGLAAIRRIAPEAARCLRRDGWLLLEHGPDQAPAVRELLASHGFRAVATVQDLAGHDRVTEARNTRESRARLS